MKRLLSLILILALTFAFAAKSLASDGDPILEGTTSGTVTGKVYVINLAVNSNQTLSGSSLFGAWVTGASNAARTPTAGITVYLVSPSGGENVYLYNDDATTSSGNTLYVHFASGDTVKSDQTITAGTSKFIVGGTALEKSLLCWSTGTSVWVVKTSGTPTVAWD